MNASAKERPRLFERLKKGLEELSQEARAEITLRATEVEVPDTLPDEERLYAGDSDGLSAHRL